MGVDIAINLILPVIIASLAALPGLAALRSQNNKRNIESDSLASDAWKELLEPYRSRVQALEEDVSQLRIMAEQQERQIKNLQAENVMLINGVNLLTSQIRASGMNPVWEYTEGS